MTDQHPRKPDWLPILVLVGIVGLICVVVLIFPYLQAFVQHENCVGVGRVDCG